MCVLVSRFQFVRNEKHTPSSIPFFKRKGCFRRQTSKQGQSPIHQSNRAAPEVRVPASVPSLPQTPKVTSINEGDTSVSSHNDRPKSSPGPLVSLFQHSSLLNHQRTASNRSRRLRTPKIVIALHFKRCGLRRCLCFRIPRLSMLSCLVASISQQKLKESVGVHRQPGYPACAPRTRLLCLEQVCFLVLPYCRARFL